MTKDEAKLYEQLKRLLFKINQESIKDVTWNIASGKVVKVNRGTSTVDVIVNRGGQLLTNIKYQKGVDNITEGDLCFLITDDSKSKSQITALIFGANTIQGRVQTADSLSTFTNKVIPLETNSITSNSYLDVYRGASVAYATGATIIFDNITNDISSGYSNGLYYVTTPGRYLVTGTFGYNGTVSGRRYGVQVMQNGVAKTSALTYATGTGPLRANYLTAINAGLSDTIAIVTSHDPGGNVGINVGADATSFSMTLLHKVI